MRRRRLSSGALFAAALAWLCVVAAPPAATHGIAVSYIAVTVLADRADLAVLVPATDMFTHFSADADQDGRISPAEFDAVLPSVYTFLEASVVFTIDGARIPLRRPVGVLHRRLRQDETGTPMALLELSAPIPRDPETVTLALEPAYFKTLGEQLTVLAGLTTPSGKTEQAVLAKDHLDQVFRLREPVPMRAQLAKFIVLGIKHIFLGYDHIMFLFALILLGGQFLNLVKIVTAFTVAHSITLILAALQIVTLPSRVIESSIALTIAYVAAENLFLETAGHRWRLTFCFGLVHGFGFANVLRQMGLPRQGLILSLLGFNLGVEVGQICIVGVMFPVVLWLNRQPRLFRRRVITVASCGVLVFGVCWFVERAFAIKFMPF